MAIKLNKEYNNKIDDFINKYDSSKNELEISFFSNEELSKKLISDEKINNLNVILSSITHKNNKKYETKHETSLDIILSIHDNNLTNYRLTIMGITKINDYLKLLNKRKNELIFSLLIDYLNKDDSLKIIKKIKDVSNYIQIPDYYMRIKLDSELKLSKDELDKLLNIKENFSKYTILYRLKQRTSYYIPKDKNIFQIDITTVKQSYKMTDIENTIPNIEFELECIINDKKTIKNEMLNICAFIIKCIQQTNNIITKSESDMVLKSYRDILGLSSEDVKLYGRKPESLGVHHVVDELSNRYAVTDKADGERNLMIIINDECFLISSNLLVKKLGLNSKHNNTIMDGEYIYISKEKKYLFMIFDVLMVDNIDIRDEINFMTRIEKSHDVIDDINNTTYKYSKMDLNKYNTIDKILNYHKENIIELYNDINETLKKSKNENIVRRKYFMCPTGATDNEIFKMTTLMWNLYESDSNVACPYLLDGLIYQGLNQKYTTIKSFNKYPEYKWKPPSRNSIDFYVEFEKDPITGKILTVYNNSNIQIARDEYEEDQELIEGKIKDKLYCICNLFLWNTSKNDVVIPVLFNRDKSISQCYIYLNDDGTMRSMDNKIINDKTVVEFYYENNERIENKMKWKPLKTRYDKTEIVQKYKKDYGNSYYVGQKIWESILNPVLIEHFDLLTYDDKYYENMELLKSKINTKYMREDLKNAYYQVSLVKRTSFQKFQNWIKSLLLYTYINAYYNHMSYDVLELSCGKSAELEKYYYATINKLVGIDIDLNGLINSKDGAIARYNNKKKQSRNIFQAIFIQGTPTNLLTYEEQVKKIGKMNNDMKEKFNKYIPNSIYDRIHVGFALHYYFDTETSWSNVCKNLNTHLREGGFFIFETFDDTLLFEKLENGPFELFTQNNGNKILLTKIIKNCDEKQKSPFGLEIQNHMSWISDEGVYISEYVVRKDFVIKSLDEECNMELIETVLFKDIYSMHEKYLKLSSSKDSDKFDVKRSKEILDFYENNELNDQLRQITFLNRLYVFRKRETNLKKNKKEFYNKGVRTDVYHKKKI
jgi:SAM-dependent methyltransferase